MGERERRVIDRRAVRRGCRIGLTTGALAFGALAVLRLVINPVVRDLSGGASLPDLGAFGVVAAVLGGLVGYGAMRASGRYVAAGGGVSDADCDRYGRALAIARAESRRGGDGGAARRDQGSAPVRVWSLDLLHGDVGDEASGREGLT